MWIKVNLKGRSQIYTDRSSQIVVFIDSKIVNADKFANENPTTPTIRRRKKTMFQIYNYKIMYFKQVFIESAIWVWYFDSLAFTMRFDLKSHIHLIVFLCTRFHKTTWVCVCVWLGNKIININCDWTSLIIEVKEVEIS